MRFRQVHLDFHTSEKIAGIGSKFDKKQFQEALKLGHVDSITVFSKCHHGWAYHPSEANEMHPGLTFDLLKAEIDAAHEIGVKTPIYISAGLDEKMAVRHPEWLVVLMNGSTTWVPDFKTPGYHKFCMNTPYLPYLLAQVREVCERYDGDGIFMDIVGVQPCVCPACRAQLLAEGKDPTNKADVLDLAERTYKKYYTAVLDTVHAIRPDWPVFENSGHARRGRRDLAFANTHQELESLPTGGWGYDHFPLSARYVQGIGQEYLGMTGKFHTSWGEFGGFKLPAALRYEVALSAANGAKCSIGDQLHPTGEMDLATYGLIGEAYAELEAKEPWLDGVKSVADVALLSYESTCTINEDDDNVDAGAVRILLEGKYLFDVIDEQYDLTGYKVVILPDKCKINPTMKAKLDAFVAAGGKLLVTGTSALNADRKEFLFDLGARYTGENEYRPSYLNPLFAGYRHVVDTNYVLYEAGQKVTLAEGGEELARIIDPYFNRTIEHFCSHKHTPASNAVGGCAMTQGKDGIYVAWPMFREYAVTGSYIAKEAICYALDRLLGESKTLTTDLPAQGVVTLMDQAARERFVCHVLYASPVKRGNGIEVIEDLLPIPHTHLELRLPKKVKNVYLAPTGRKLFFTERNGTVTVDLPEFVCHQMVVFDYEV